MPPTQTPPDTGNHHGRINQPQPENQANHKQITQPPPHRFETVLQENHTRFPVYSPRSIQNRQCKNLIDKCLKRLDQHELFAKPFVKEFLEDRSRRGCSPKTIKSYFDGVFQFFAYVKTTGQSSIETLTRDDVSGFVEHLQDRGLAPATVQIRLDGAYIFLTYMEDKDIVNPKLLKKKFKIKLPDRLPRAMDPDDVEAFRLQLNEPRSKAMFLLLLRTGMRIGELLNTRVGEVNLKEKRIDIYEASKNRIGRVVHFSDDARDALVLWLETRNPTKCYVFYGRDKEQLSYECARAKFHEYIQKAGLSHKGYTLHCLRHTCASELLNAGMRLECLQQLLGHNNIEMTRRYARLTDNTRKEEYFRAMKIIEKGGINGHYRRDYKLPKTSKETQLLTAHD